MTANPVVPTIPLDENGVHHGFLRLPHSRDDSAWGAVMIPITVICNGQGPTALFTGGNHGDEYEGPIALQELAVNLCAEGINGRIIIVPFFNTPAFLAGKRTSPIDGGNLNRAFPGKPDGTVTQKIADYFAHTLVPMADLVLDFHSGGKTLDFVPFAACHVLEDKHQQQKCTDAMLAFGAPYSMTMLEIDNVGMFDSCVEEQGKVFVTTELGGGGSASARTVEIARRGARNLLCHMGILNEKPIVVESIRLDMPDQDCFHVAVDEGLLEMKIDLAQPVQKGDVLACIWPKDRTGMAAIEIHSKMDGILAARHFPGLVKMGDCIGVIAQPV